MPTETNLDALTKLWENTRVPPPDKVDQFKRGERGPTLDYVGHADVTDILLASDITWNWRPATAEETPTGGPALERDEKGRPCGMWIVLTIHGLSRLGYGSVDGSKSDAMKELIGDALRNASMRFGVALTLWSKAERNGEQSASQQRNAARTKKAEPKEEAKPAEPAAPAANDLVSPQTKLFNRVKSFGTDKLAEFKKFAAESTKLAVDPESGKLYFDKMTAEEIPVLEKWVDEHAEADPANEPF